MMSLLEFFFSVIIHITDEFVNMGLISDNSLDVPTKRENLM